MGNRRTSDNFSAQSTSTHPCSRMTCPRRSMACCIRNLTQLDRWSNSLRLSRVCSRWRGRSCCSTKHWFQRYNPCGGTFDPTPWSSHRSPGCGNNHRCNPSWARRRTAIHWQLIYHPKWSSSETKMRSICSCFHATTLWAPNLTHLNFLRCDPCLLDYYNRLAINYIFDWLSK